MLSFNSILSSIFSSYGISTTNSSIDCGTLIEFNISLTCFISIIRNKINEKSTLLYLTIIGHTLFLMIFEARARYLIIYLPVYITIASCAFNYLRKEENK